MDIQISYKIGDNSDLSFICDVVIGGLDVLAMMFAPELVEAISEFATFCGMPTGAQSRRSMTNTTDYSLDAFQKDVRVSSFSSF